LHSVLLCKPKESLNAAMQMVAFSFYILFTGYSVIIKVVLIFFRNTLSLILSLNILRIFFMLLGDKFFM